MKIPNYIIPYTIVIIVSLLIVIGICVCGDEAREQSDATKSQNDKTAVLIRDTSANPADHMFECLTSEDAKACVYIMLRTHGYPVDFDNINLTVTDTDSLGFGLNCYLEKYGYVHNAYHSSYQDLYFPTILSDLEQGIPVMVYMKDHWIVAYAVEDDIIKISDPWHGLCDMESSKFNDIWTQSSKQTIVIK